MPDPLDAATLAVLCPSCRGEIPTAQAKWSDLCASCDPPSPGQDEALALIYEDNIDHQGCS